MILLGLNSPATEDEEDFLEISRESNFIRIRHDENKISAFRWILKNHQCMRIRQSGRVQVLIDVQTANAVCMVYDALKPESQKKLLAWSMGAIAGFAWKNVRFG